MAKSEAFTPGKAYKTGLSWLFVSPKQWGFTLRGFWYIPSKKVNPEIGVQINTKRSKKAQICQV
jgi:hypothetical protein